MKREKLEVQKRAINGKKVKKLRREGVLPANVYGQDFNSTQVQLPLNAFNSVYAVAKETGLVDLVLDGATIPVLIKNVQIHPRSQDPVHADFHKVNLREKITAKIPIEAIGESIAVLEKKGDLIQPLAELEVEALPTDLPEKIEVSIENLKEVNDQIIVSDLKAPTGVTIVTDGGELVFKISEFVKEEVVEAPAEAAEGEAAAEGAEAKEGTAAPEEKKEEQPQEKKEEK